MGGGKRQVEARCTGAGDPEDNMIINQIMLRFRPIAPRPVTVESTVNLVPLKEKRKKRKYVRVKKKMNDQAMAMLEVSNGAEFVTDPVRKQPEWISFDVSGNSSDETLSRWISTPARSMVDLHDGDLAVTVNRPQLVESWITVESVIGTCEDDGREIWKDLEMDTCPGFVSNGYDEVQWVNLAYRRMVDPNPDGGAPPPEVVVWLVLKGERSGFEYWPAFSCRVRVVYLLSEKKKQMTVTVPCDVWKMDSGGYAWRLDVKAALSLGRLN
ncbi:hypothetical protein R6Q57_012121 [Mikania cordata]